MLERTKYNEEMDKVRNNQVNEIAEYLKDYIKRNSDIRNMPIDPRPNEEVINKIINMEIPRKGRDPKIVGDEIVNDILGNCTLIQHPRFLSFVASSVSPYSIAGSVLTDIYNPNAAGFEISIGASLVEEKLIKWMGSRAGFDESCGGLFTSGGSLSNLTCMIAARENKLPGRFDLPNGVAFFSDQAHSSIVKGLRMMGLRSDQCVKIDSDDDFKIRVDLLEEAILKAKAEGKKPFLIISTLGTTNTGSIDPFDKLGEIAKKYDMWLHVDGAYGGSVLFSDIYNNLAKGIECADSLSWDTHKWAMQTYSCSCAIVKDKQHLITAFNEHPEYLEDVRSLDHNDAWDLGIEMSRPARYIKLWYTIQAMGTDLLSDVIDYAFFNSKQAENALVKLPDWEIVSKPCCGTLNFRYAPKDVPAEKYDELNESISKKMLENGYAYVVTTTIKGKKVLRLCVISGSVEIEDVLNTVEMLNNIAVLLKNKYI